MAKVFRFVNYQFVFPSKIKKELIFPRSTSSYWIGLSDIKTEGEWTYIDGVKKTADNTDFANGEPNNNNGADCGLLFKFFGYKMDDNPCTRKYFAVCERIE